MNSVLSPLKWAGSKRFLASRIRPLLNRELPSDPIVTELFAGSLSFSLELGYNRVLANDLNKALMNFFKHIQRGYVPTCANFPIDKVSYYNYRDRYNELIRKGSFNAEMADLTLYLNAIGFNGLYRTSNKSGYNVPFGKAKEFPIEKIHRCRLLTKAIENWTLSSDCFSDVPIGNDTDLVYVDPPYHGTFTAYTSKFTLDDQVSIIDKLSDVSAPVVISNSLSSEMVALYKDAGFKLYKTQIKRRISANQSSRTNQFELVAFRGFTTKRIANLTTGLERI